MSPVRVLLFGALLLAASGCREEQIVTYQIPKESGAEARREPGSGPLGDEAAMSAKWEAPPSWKAQPTSPMRQGSWIITGDGGQADVSVIALPGDVGGDLANVNRWRGQIQLPPITDEELAKQFESVESNGLKFKVVDIASEADAEKQLRILGAILEQDGKNWFFKMMGDEPVVAAQKEPFLGFLKTVRLPGPESASAPGRESKEPAGAAGPATAATGPVTWKTPAGWKEQAASGMRQGSFLIEGEEGQKADVSIIGLGGGVGGLLANINRWRGQIGLAPIQESDLAAATSKIEVDGREAIFVDMAGEAPTIDNKYPGQILAAIVENGEKTWFIKMSGAGKLVSVQKPAFVEFLKTLHFHN